MADIICYELDERERNTEVGFLKQSSVRETAPLHTHSFYEIFLVIQGMALHIVNDSVQTIKAGDLVLIRPTDCHCYDFYQSYDFEFMNLGFPVKTFDLISAFLENASKTGEIASSHLPPICSLSPQETQHVADKFLHIKESIEHQPRGFTRLEFRAFLADIIVQYFLGFSVRVTEEPKIPVWIDDLKKTMSSIENLKVGFPCMLRFANCSKEHLCREFKRFTGMTPTIYINRERLFYSMYLLCHTNLEIVEIADNCGFNNLSHFYHLFKKQFGMAPAAMRKTSNQLC